MATKKKMLQAAAGSATGGGGLDITDVFSTYLYEGNGSTQTITNDIDLAGEGGLVWIKERTALSLGYHALVDTERGATKQLFTNLANAESSSTSGLTSFSASGFSLGNSNIYNVSGGNLASWTFRKAPKFFDVVTYTGNGTANRTISHNLGTTVGAVIVKNLTDATNWAVKHRSSNMLLLNSSSAALGTGDTEGVFGTTAFTSSTFTVDQSSLTNQSGKEYVAYLFAHNDGDGEFGPDGDADIIKCGSYTGNQNTTGPVIDLGFEPQWLMIKNTSAARPWIMLDTMRGTTVGTSNAGSDEFLLANASDAEDTDSYLSINSTGFQLRDIGGNVNASNENYIYMAIRRGPLAQPESGTEVFEVFKTTNTGTASTIGSMGPSDFILNKRTDAAATWRALDRLRGGSMLRTDSTDTETTSSGFLEWDKMGGVFVTAAGAPYITNDAQAHWLWKRAPGFFDVVAYTGNGTAGRTVSHNLGVAPEMIWVKNRNFTQSWLVWHKSIANTEYLLLNSVNAKGTGTWAWNSTSPTATSFSVGNDPINNDSSYNYIAYLFATVPGVSKVGSYTGTGGTPQNIDCGFTSGARFVLIKKSSGTGDWWVFDTARGIVSGNDPALNLNTTDAEDNSYDMIDPYSAGFTVTDAGYDMNESGSTYIFYAIA